MKKSDVIIMGFVFLFLFLIVITSVPFNWAYFSYYILAFVALATIVGLLYRHATMYAEERHRLVYGSNEQRNSSYGQSSYQNEMDRLQARKEFYERERQQKEREKWARGIKKEWSHGEGGFNEDYKLPKNPFKEFNRQRPPVFKKGKRPRNPYDL